MEFVPSGYIPLLRAVRRVMEHRFPNLGEPLSEAEREELSHLHRVTTAPPPPAQTASGRGSGETKIHDAAWAERVNARRAALKAKLRAYERTVEEPRTAAAAALRQALAEGAFPSEYIGERGEPVQIRQEAWRTEAGWRAMATGRAPVGPSSMARDRSVLIREDDLERWLEPPPPRRAASDPAALRTAMLAIARETMRATNAKPFREASIKACMEQTGCTYAEATAAWDDGVPSDLKRGAAETSRTKAGRQAPNVRRSSGE